MLKGHYDNYNQHFTCAIVKIWSPRIEYQKEEWKNKVIEDFMNVNILTKEDIKATFIAENLEQWEIKMGKTTRLAMTVEFKEKFKTLISISWCPYKNERKKQERQIIGMFNKYETMYDFVKYVSQIL